MEFARHGRPTASAAYDADDSRPYRFPVPPPPPPPHGDGDLAARRRGELPWELHNEHIRQDMILRELAETERAMAARFGHPGHWPLRAPPPSQDYWQHRTPPSLPLWDEAPPRPPRAMAERPPCSRGSPAAARPPPVYPHVERSPSPVPRSPPADDVGDLQQECRSPRSMLSGDLEGCRSPSMQALREGALVPAAATAGAGTMMPASFAEEVIPGDRRAAGGEEPKHGVEDGHGVQPLSGSANQSSEQMKTEESTVKDQTDELLARPCQYRPAGQENGASEEQKRIAFREPTPHQAEGLKRKLATPTSLVTTKKQMKHERFKWICDLCQVIKPTPRSMVAHQASKRHLSMLKARNKPARSPPCRPIVGESMTENNGGGGGSENVPRPAEDEDQEATPSSRWTCRVCNARCYSDLIFQGHLIGRKHHANTEAILALFRSSYTRNNDDSLGNSEYNCNACGVHFTGDNMLALHLVGVRHWKTLEGDE